jgi:hypothetical protein
MARTWSNAKKTDDLSASQKANSRPTNITAFLILITLFFVFFFGLILYVAIDAEMHPPTVQIPPSTQQPKDD